MPDLSANHFLGPFGRNAVLCCLWLRVGRCGGLYLIGPAWVGVTCLGLGFCFMTRRIKYLAFLSQLAIISPVVPIIPPLAMASW